MVVLVWRLGLVFMQGSGGFLGFRGSDFRVQGSGFGSYGVRVLGYLGLEVLRGPACLGLALPVCFGFGV